MLPFENLFIEGQQFFYSDTDPAAAGAAAGAAAASAAASVFTTACAVVASEAAAEAAAAAPAAALAAAPAADPWIHRSISFIMNHIFYFEMKSMTFKCTNASVVLIAACAS